MPPHSLTTLSRFATWLDAGIRVPGTQLRFGLDPIIGLVPGIGDAAGAVLAGWIFVAAVRMGASRATLMRIAVNIVVDAGVGAIPVLGDLFDFAWKSNLRNVAILQRHLAQPVRAQRADRTFVALVACGVLALGAGLLSLGVLLTVWLVRVLGCA